VIERGAGEHLILVGLPGAGKSTVGRALAVQLGVPFLDFDTEIERREGAPVSRIFRERGEAAFRAMERGLTEELRRAPAHVLAPGGGWMTIPGNAELLRPPSHVVYLRLSPGAALRRLGAGVARRPLLSGPSPLVALERLYSERDPIYAGADVVLDVEHLDLQGVIRNLRQLASLRGPS
jgi:shikimate kinase